MLQIIHPACRVVIIVVTKHLTSCQHGEIIRTLKRAERVLLTLTQP
jgi:hypothetical protein